MIPLIVACCSHFFSGAAAQDRLILRDLQVVSGKVQAWDEDGVQMDQRVIGWNAIDSAVLEKDQSDFETWRNRLGPTLYQIHYRLLIGDYQRVEKPAAVMAPIYEQRRSFTAYLVYQALMWGRIEQGRREEALAAYFRCRDLLQEHPEWRERLPGPRRLQDRADIALSDELAPVFFNPQAAQQTLASPLMSEASTIGRLPAGYDVYRAGLLLAAGDVTAAGDLLLPRDSADAELDGWRAVLLAQQHLLVRETAAAETHLRRVWPTLSASQRPWAMYWLAQTLLASTESQRRVDGLLWLARIASMCAEQAEPAAAALFVMQQSLPTSLASSRPLLLRDLQYQYAHTYFGRRAKDLYEQP